MPMNLKKLWIINRQLRRSSSQLLIIFDHINLKFLAQISKTMSSQQNTYYPKLQAVFCLRRLGPAATPNFKDLIQSRTKLDMVFRVFPFLNKFTDYCKWPIQVPHQRGRQILASFQKEQIRRQYLGRPLSRCWWELQGWFGIYRSLFFLIFSAKQSRLRLLTFNPWNYIQTHRIFNF